VRVHRPRSAGPALPCLVSMHGGGYVMGTHLGDDGRFDAWCPRFGCVGVSVGYRLAPETPFPGPLEDCYAALRWVHRRGLDIGVDPARIGVMGGSAGGGLAAGLTLLVWVLLSADAYIAVGNAILNGVIAQAEWQTYMRRG